MRLQGRLPERSRQKGPGHVYIVGWDARLAAFLTWALPNRAIDWLAMMFWRQLGLKEK